MVARSSYSAPYFIKSLRNHLRIILTNITNKTKRGIMKKDLKDLLIDELHDILKL
jgi:hypothetical protein